MTKANRFCAARIRVGSSSHTLDQISAVLGVEPTQGLVATPLKGLSINEDPSASERIWVLRSARPESDDLEFHLVDVLNTIEQCRPGLLSLCAEGAWAEVSGTVASRSGQFHTSISPETLARIVALELDLMLNLYPPQS